MNTLAAAAAFVIAFIAGVFGVKQFTANDVKIGKVIMESPAPTPDPTAEWKLYTNDKLGFSFKLPPGWVLDTKDAAGDEAGHNFLVVLTKNTSKISVYADLVGIGGVGRDYQGVPVTVNGVRLYEYHTEQAETQTNFIGLTDTLTQSLGVFQAGGKTYSITLEYPAAFTPGQQAAIEGEFNNLLSTFVFGIK